MSCEICGGSSKCPAYDYAEVIEAMESDQIWLDINNPTPEGYRVTHERPQRGRKLCMPLKKGEYVLEIVGRKQSQRIAAHYNVGGLWCGWNMYAFYVKLKKYNYEECFD